jgi:predicted neuraminidase
MITLFAQFIKNSNGKDGSGKIRLLLLAGLLIAFVQVLYVFSQTKPEQSHFRLQSPIAVSASTKPRYSAKFVTTGKTSYVHTVSVVELSDGRLRAFWYGGSREGAGDVTIRSAVFSIKNQQWHKATDVIGRIQTQDALRRFIKKLGNMVVLRAPASNRLWLFYVSVSVGGWSGSSINMVLSDDEGLSWSKPVRLISSPFLNISTLVKGPPFFYTDGSIGLPVYHEFAGKFAELLRVNRQGQVILKTRISRGRVSLQPVVVPRDANHAIAFMRFSGKRPRRILSSTTKDGGIHWSRPEKTSLRNPNAAVASIRLADNSLLMVFNNTEKGRYDLSLAHSQDAGQSWKIVYQFEDASRMSAEKRNKQRFAYPWLLQGSNGDYHLFYTWHNRNIKHITFNHAWLRSKL